MELPENPADRFAGVQGWAVVGASNDPKKFGNRIYRALRDSGYRVWPVNRHEAVIEGDRAYPNLAALPEVPSVVNFVIPPRASLEVAREAIDLGVRALWFQPGAENVEAAREARLAGLVVIEDCILVRRRRPMPSEG